jgi:hypothetical protein
LFCFLLRLRFCIWFYIWHLRSHILRIMILFYIRYLLFMFCNIACDFLYSSIFCALEFLNLHLCDSSSPWPTIF